MRRRSESRAPGNNFTEEKDMKKKSKNDVWNLIFSAFLVTAFMVCSTFFTGMINDSFEQDTVKRVLLTALIFVLFGLILFYATRVGDGKQVIRFSAATLILMVLPALYVILASVITAMPFHSQLSQHYEAVNIAAVILGYGLPYTFVSGYELDRSDDKTDGKTDDKPEEAEETAEEQPAEEDYTEAADEVPDEEEYPTEADEEAETIPEETEE